MSKASIYVCEHAHVAPNGMVFPCSSTSLSFTTGHDNGTMSRSGEVTVQIDVVERYLELLKRHQLIKDNKAPAFPLLSAHPSTTMAILICKLLVPVGDKAICLDVNQGSHYTTPVAARVYPHFLVHVGPNSVAYSNSQQGRQAKRMSNDRSCRCLWVTVILILLGLLVGLLCGFHYRGHKF
jgi:hypothetical protein